MKKIAIVSIAFSISAFAAQSSSITATGGFAAIVPDSSKVSAAYMTLHNSSQAELSLVGASSSDAKTIEIHQHIHQGNTMKMKRLQSVPIPAGGQAELAPMGLHLMLIGLKPSFFKDRLIPLVLRFSDGSSLKLELPKKSDE